MSCFRYSLNFLHRQNRFYLNTIFATQPESSGWQSRCYILIFSPYSFFPPEKWVYTSFSPGKISIYSFFPPERSVYTHLSPWFLGGKSEYILKFPPHTQFSPFALIDYTRAITPIRGRPYGDICRAFDAEEGRSPLFFSICNTFWNISQWLQFDPYVLFLAMAAMFFSSTDI